MHVQVVIPGGNGSLISTWITCLVVEWSQFWQGTICYFCNCSCCGWNDKWDGCCHFITGSTCSWPIASHVHLHCRNAKMFLAAAVWNAISTAVSGLTMVLAMFFVAIEHWTEDWNCCWRCSTDCVLSPLEISSEIPGSVLGGTSRVNRARYIFPWKPFVMGNCSQNMSFLVSIQKRVPCILRSLVH